MKTAYIGEMTACNLAEGLRELDPIFSFVKGDKKSEIIQSIIDNMNERLAQYYQGNGNCLEDYYWNFTPCSVRYEEPCGDYFYINFFTGEIRWGNSGED